MKAGSTALKGLTNAEMHDRIATLEAENQRLKRYEDAPKSIPSGQIDWQGWVRTLEREIRAIKYNYERSLKKRDDLERQLAKFLGLFSDYHQPCKDFEQAEKMWNRMRDKAVEREQKLAEAMAERDVWRETILDWESSAEAIAKARKLIDAAKGKA